MAGRHLGHDWIIPSGTMLLYLLLHKIKRGHLPRSQLASDLLSGRRDFEPTTP
jgi:hypothetical protein